jgi:predicted metal-binding protein
MTAHSPQIELLVCIRCRRGADRADGADAAAGADGAERPGAVLHRRLAEDAPQGVAVTPVECLSNCDHGCTVALRGAGRWTYVYGRFDATADLAALRDGVARYRDTPDGLVPWRERPEHFRRNCIARIPPLPPAPPSEGHPHVEP